MGTYEGLKFSNVETDTEDVERALKGVKENDKDKEDEKHENTLPEDDVSTFSSWVKNELQPYV